MFIAASFITAKEKQTQSKHLLTAKWINKMWHAHIMEYYLPIKRDEVMISTTVWMNLETLCLVKEAIHKSPVLYGSFYRQCSEQINLGTSLVVHWLRPHSLNSEGPGSIPCQGTRSYTPQLTVHTLQLKILKAAAKTWCSQMNK